MDPEQPPKHSQQAFESCVCFEEENKALKVSQPYSSNKQATQQLMSQLLSKIAELKKDGKDIMIFQWKWASNNLTSEQINQIVQILPQQICQFWMSGSTQISLENLQNIINKFNANITKLNLYLGAPQSPCDFFNNNQNSLEYQVQIKNSLKNYRQRAKWCSNISKKKKQLVQKIIRPNMGLKNVIQLSLRNIVIGGNTNMDKNANKCMQNLLVSCPNIRNLDLSHCQIVDEQFQSIKDGELLLGLGKRLECLRLVCNRISLKTLKAIFGDNQVSKQMSHPNLQLLDISETSITEPQLYEFLITKMNNLKSLGIGQLIMDSKSILRVHQQMGFKWAYLQQMILDAVQLSYPALSAIFTNSPQLNSISLHATQIEAIQKQKHLACIFPKKLTYLDLTNMPLVDDQFITLFVQSAYSNLRVLKLSGTKMTGLGLQIISENKNQSLKWLEISSLDSLFQTPQQNNVSTQQTQPLERVYKPISQQNILSIVKQIITNYCNLQYLQAYNIVTKKQHIQELLEFLQTRNQQVWVAMDGSGAKLIQKKAQS